MSQCESLKTSKCCVSNCNDKSSKRHRFPRADKEPEIFKLCFQKVNNPLLCTKTDEQIRKTYYVCDRHYTDEVKLGSRRGLWNIAIPVLFLPSQSGEVDDLHESQEFSNPTDAVPRDIHGTYWTVAESKIMAFRVSQQHWELIVNFMEKHPGMAKGRIEGPSGNEQMKRLWDQLSQELNALGMGSRTSIKWKKSWINFKHNLKRRAMESKRHMQGTGGGPPKGNPLSDVELRILNILGDSFFQGSGLPESGCSFMMSPPQASISIALDEAQTINLERPEPITPRVNVKEAVSESTLDHDYTRTPSLLKRRPRRLKPDSEMEKMYMETLTELRGINVTLKELCTNVHGIYTALDTIAKKMCDK